MSQGSDSGIESQSLGKNILDKIRPYRLKVFIVGAFSHDDDGFAFPYLPVL